MKRYLIIRFIFTILLSTSAFANYGKADDYIGKPGDLANVFRTIKITAIEYMFLPAEINVTQGETIKFVVENKGNKKQIMNIINILSEINCF